MFLGIAGFDDNYLKFIRYETVYFYDSFFDDLYGAAFWLRTAGANLQ